MNIIRVLIGLLFMAVGVSAYTTLSEIKSRTKDRDEIFNASCWEAASIVFIIIGTFVLIN